MVTLTYKTGSLLPGCMYVGLNTVWCNGHFADLFKIRCTSMK